MLGRLNHVAIAVPDIKTAAEVYRSTFAMGAKVSKEVAQPDHGVTTVFIELDNTKIELLEPLGEKSPIANFLKKNPSGGIHHIAFGTDDVQGQLKQAADAGVKLIHDKPFDGAGGKLVAFLHPKSTYGVLTEFCMPKPGNDSCSCSH